MTPERFVLDGRASQFAADPDRRVQSDEPTSVVRLVNLYVEQDVLCVDVAQLQLPDAVKPKRELAGLRELSICFNGYFDSRATMVDHQPLDLGIVERNRWKTGSHGHLSLGHLPGPVFGNDA